MKMKFSYPLGPSFGLGPFGVRRLRRSAPLPPPCTPSTRRQHFNKHHRQYCRISWRFNMLIPLRWNQEPLCRCVLRLLPSFILLVAQTIGSDIIWRPQTRSISSLRLPCSQQHYPCRIHDVKFCAARGITYLGAASWDNAAHVWSLKGCPPLQTDCDFEMYASSASRLEVCPTHILLELLFQCS